MARPALTGAVVILMCVPADGHVGSQVVPVYELAPSQLPDLHDHALEDWEDVSPDASLTMNEFSFNAHPPDPANLAFRMLAGWSFAEQRLYFGIERIDDVYVPAGDYARVAIDGDHSGGPFWYTESEIANEQERDRRNGAQAQVYFVGEEFGSPDARFEMFARAKDWAGVPPFTDMGFLSTDEDPSHLTVELGVTPWDDLNWEGPENSVRTGLEPWQFIGLQVTLYDVDTPGTLILDGTYSFPGPSDAVGADSFGDAVLIPCEERGCSDAGTAVDASSWGRIKASLR